MVFLKSLPKLAVLTIAFGVTASLFAQGGPADYDLEIRLDSGSYDKGDTVTATVGIVARVAGLQGWSYGAVHDNAVLDLETAEQSADTAAARVEPSFEVTRLIEETEGGTRLGFIQGVVLSFIAPAVVPESDFFGFADATYTVRDDIDCGEAKSFETSVDISEKLSAPGSPPVDVNLTVDGRAIIPDAIRNGSATINCAVAPPPGELVLSFGPEGPCVVTADGESTLDIEVLLSNAGEKGQREIQGWSYGVAMNFDAIIAIDAAPGADSAALNGGTGPEFVHYNLEDADEANAVRGVTVGAVVELDAPGTEVLSVGGGQTMHIDTITIRAVPVLAAGESQMTELSFADQALGGDRPLEILFVENGDSFVPDFSATKTATLQGAEAPGAIYLRGDANSDSRVDIADGVWIISMLFRGQEMTACMPAANSNGDGKVDISDALFLFNYRLQPGATPQALFPAPSAPFPECGLDPDADAADCPAGSHICNS